MIHGELKNYVAPVRGDTAFICSIPEGTIAASITIGDEHFYFGGLLTYDITYGTNDIVWNFERTSKPDPRVGCPEAYEFDHIIYWSFDNGITCGWQIMRPVCRPK